MANNVSLSPTESTTGGSVGMETGVTPGGRSQEIAIFVIAGCIAHFSKDITYKKYQQYSFNVEKQVSILFQVNVYRKFYSSKKMTAYYSHKSLP